MLEEGGKEVLFLWSGFEIIAEKLLGGGKEVELELELQMSTVVRVLFPSLNGTNGDEGGMLDI